MMVRMRAVLILRRAGLDRSRYKLAIDEVPPTTNPLGPAVPER